MTLVCLPVMLFVSNCEAYSVFFLFVLTIKTWGHLRTTLLHLLSLSC